MPIIPDFVSKCFVRFSKGSYYSQLGPMPVFVSGKNFMMETKIGLYFNPLRRADWGNTGKAFGDKAENAYHRLAQMLCPYVSTLESATV